MKDLNVTCKERHECKDGRTSCSDLLCCVVFYVDRSGCGALTLVSSEDKTRDDSACTENSSVFATTSVPFMPHDEMCSSTQKLRGGIGVATSGGGMYSMMFGFAMFAALHEMTWLWENVHYMSGTSGGSWFTVQLRDNLGLQKMLKTNSAAFVRAWQRGYDAERRCVSKLPLTHNCSEVDREILERLLCESGMSTGPWKNFVNTILMAGSKVDPHANGPTLFTNTGAIVTLSVPQKIFVEDRILSKREGVRVLESARHITWGRDRYAPLSTGRCQGHDVISVNDAVAGSSAVLGSMATANIAIDREIPKRMAGERLVKHLIDLSPRDCGTRAMRDMTVRAQVGGHTHALIDGGFTDTTAVLNMVAEMDRQNCERCAIMCLGVRFSAFNSMFAEKCRTNVFFRADSIEWVPFVNEAPGYYTASFKASTCGSTAFHIRPGVEFTFIVFYVDETVQKISDISSASNFASEYEGMFANVTMRRNMTAIHKSLAGFTLS